MKNKLFILIFSLALLCKLQAQYTLTAADVTFSGGEITDYRNTSEKDIIIPDNIDGVLVTSIGYEAFVDSELTSVTIPNSFLILSD